MAGHTNSFHPSAGFSHSQSSPSALCLPFKNGQFIYFPLKTSVIIGLFSLQPLHDVIEIPVELMIIDNTNNTDNSIFANLDLFFMLHITFILIFHMVNSASTAHE